MICPLPSSSSRATLRLHLGCAALALLFTSSIALALAIKQFHPVAFVLCVVVDAAAVDVDSNAAAVDKGA